MIKILLTATVCIITGYALGNVLPLSNFSNNEATTGSPETQTATIPEGKGRLIVSVKDDSDRPVVGVEIDVAFRPGPPESWGIGEADVDGRAAFDLSPGNYYVYFNENRFPTGYTIQPEQQVSVQAGQVTNVSIVLESK